MKLLSPMRHSYLINSYHYEKSTKKERLYFPNQRMNQGDLFQKYQTNKKYKNRGGGEHQY
ncbi:MAG TPA: hypothetical protein VK766_03305 [Cytophagaceae bacterium]|nr:hypothetical protein [Cytophagaceae bacterium]